MFGEQNNPPFLRRACACGRHASSGSECGACKRSRQGLQRWGSSRSAQDLAPPIVHDVLRGPGQPLDGDTRSLMESRFSHDFSRVRVHTDAMAAASAQAVNAHAYTVGRHIAFAENQYAPATSGGRRLIGHELAHVVQQDGALSSQAPSRLTVDRPGDASEQAADAAAGGGAAGYLGSQPATTGQPVLQRETPIGESEKKPEEKKDSGDVVAEGLKTVAEQATDNNPAVKKVIIEPIKDRLKGQWNRLGTGEKAAAISFGVGTLGMTGGAMLSDPSGRKHLEGVNLAAPLTLIPYMPLTSFKYTLPSGDDPDKHMFKFETSFNADDLINLRTESRGLPKMSLGVNLQWGYDLATDRLTVLGGDASLGLVPGLSLSAGAYKDILRPSPMILGPEGQATQIKKSVPEFDKPQPIPDVRVMLTVDLLKFKPADLARQVKNFF